MKDRWKWIIGITALIGITTCVCVGFNLFELKETTQSVSIFIALIATFVAISATDPKPKEVKVSIDKSYKEDSYGIRKEDEIYKELHKELRIPLKTFEIHFKITNTSGFTLKNPTVTLCLPKNAQHIVVRPVWFFKDRPVTRQVIDFASNLYNNLPNVKDNFRRLDSNDKIYLSNSNLRYLGKGKDLTIWIRVAIHDKPLEIDVYIDADGCEGDMKSFKIDPTEQEIIDDFKKLEQENNQEG